MKKALIVSFCLLFVLASIAMARPATKGTSLADYNIDIYNNQANKLPGDLFSAAQADTYWLAAYEFEGTGGGCSALGWSSKDLTAQPGIMFHVDTYRVPAFSGGMSSAGGTKAMFCCARPSTFEPWCSYVALPGYGNAWNQTLTSRVWTVTAPVTVDYKATYDSEPGYDYTYFQYWDGTAWADLETY
ncbi:MAG: hypothetical protein HY770_08260, partial [Chitinivibrionia bacterium]|nr:hypothetical protein [Chitinivibrionia bacterium]